MIERDVAKQKASAIIDDMKKDLGLNPPQIEELLGIALEDFDSDTGWVWEFNSQIATIAIAKEQGLLVYYSNNDELVEIEPLISLADAEAEMLGFFRKYYPSFDEGSFERVRAEWAEDRYEFEYTQQQQVGEVSIFKNYIAVSVRGDTPEVISFDRSALDFVRTTPTSIDKSAAREIVQTIVGKEGKITALSLYEQPMDEATKAITVWEVFVEFQQGGLESLEEFVINADTGLEVDVEELEPEID